MIAKLSKGERERKRNDRKVQRGELDVPPYPGDASGRNPLDASTPLTLFDRLAYAGGVELAIINTVQYLGWSLSRIRLDPDFLYAQWICVDPGSKVVVVTYDQKRWPDGEMLSFQWGMNDKPFKRFVEMVWSNVEALEMAAGITEVDRRGRPPGRRSTRLSELAKIADEWEKRWKKKWELGECTKEQFWMRKGISRYTFETALKLRQEGKI